MVKMKNQTTGTLADKIAGILNTAPLNFDPEEDAVDATNAQTSFENIEDANEEEEVILSKFRRQNVDLLADVDEKYAGKKASRRSLQESSEEENSEVELPSDSDDDTGEDEEEEEIDNSTDNSSESGAESSENEEIIDDSTNFKHINDTNVSNQIKKGVCVRNQMTMWENLLEVRIQVQKCLLAANKMPTNTKFDEIKAESGAELSNKITETKTTLCSSLDKLLTLQKLCLKQYPETKILDKENGQVSTNGNEDDEEIPSDTDAEISEQEETVEIKTAKKRKLEEYETDINSNHKKFKDYRNKTIQKWNDKTRVVLKGGATSHSVLDQIEYNLSNKDKLIKKTQQKRSQYTILGEDEENVEFNPEIFDDDDFYHQLLRELIEVKSADVTDPVQLGRQWIQLQSLRSKMKRKIDTRATKGRKIRYAVHNKLVNFMAPIDKELWTDEAKTELYNSLFGKNQTV